MRKIYTIGETVLDILFKNGLPFTARPGGACLNTAVSLGRLNLPVYFISEYGLDEVGNIINQFLNENHVSTEYVYRYYDGKSALALAFLNENNDASYDFYKNYPKNRFEVQFPEIKADDIVIFGSIYAVNPEVRPKLIRFIEEAKSKNAIIIYDPNFRKSHLHDLPKLKPMIIDNLNYADIVRGSNEDFTFIFGTNDADETHEMLNYIPNLLYTASKKGVFLRTSTLSAKYQVNKIQPVSTIGAGDSFNAGIAFSLMKQGIKRNDLDKLNEKQWRNIAETAIAFATHVCLIYDNYIEHGFANEFVAKEEY
ncbi:MAG: carbohydrate kinase [Bacteroidales bacterium]|nr:carbohydrate kinase [Bacteroidales bacterium]